MRIFPLCLLLLFSCSDNSFREGKFFAGNIYVTAKTLNNGKMLYTEYCMPCHGVKGDGKGVSSKGLRVSPRDFTKGLYKFGRVDAEGPPRDEDFYRIIKKGLHGTAMIPWDMGKGQMYAVVQYLKTFAPEVWEGKEKALGNPIIPPKDPYGIARKQSAIVRGRDVYHAVGECQTCHRGYMQQDQFKKIYQKINGSVPEIDETFYQVKLQESEYGKMTVPPDFTWHDVRSAETVEELFVRIAAGVGGTAMPGWQGTLEDEDIWAISYYVKSLMEKRGKRKLQEAVR